MASPHLWYVRRGGEIQGPFPAGLVRRYVLLGRIHEGDELSADRQSWAPLESYPELGNQEQTSQGADGTWEHQRQRARLRWEDERSGLDRRGPAGTGAAGDVVDDRRHKDRRRSDQPRGAGRARAAAGTGLPTDAHERYLLRWLALGGFIVALFALAVIFPDRYPSDSSQCGAPARPKIDWSDCRLDGGALAAADLRGANLRAVSLVGATLQRADLSAADASYANFSLADLSGSNLRGATMVGATMRGSVLAGARLDGADLSYAILAGADLRGADLNGARLDNAIWTDNRVCGVGSVGRCLFAAAH
jgi:hypothetical protein